jgi:hypothetical protein
LARKAHAFWPNSNGTCWPRSTTWTTPARCRPRRRRRCSRSAPGGWRCPTRSTSSISSPTSGPARGRWSHRACATPWSGRTSTSPTTSRRRGRVRRRRPTRAGGEDWALGRPRAAHGSQLGQGRGRHGPRPRFTRLLSSHSRCACAASAAKSWAPCARGALARLHVLSASAAGVLKRR